MLGVRTLLRSLWSDTALIGYRAFRDNRTFLLNNRSYAYFYARYNSAHMNERTVEIPVAVDFVRGFENVLEVGNVLNHYVPFTHDVVDKWEQAPNVVNCDIRDYKPGKFYDRIVMISTLEHVGWDEKPRQPENLFAALDVLRSLLTPDGMMMATIPVGYNQWLDEQLLQKRLPFSRVAAMQRISRRNDWEECSIEEALNRSYGSPYGWANGLIFTYLLP